MDRPTYSYAQKRAAVRLADEIGHVAAAAELGIHRSTLSTWCMRARRGELTAAPPAWPALPPQLAYAAPGIPELRARWTARGSYQPAEPLTGRQLLARIWPDRTAAA